MAELTSKLEAMQTQLNELAHEKEVLKQTLVARKGAAARRVLDMLTSLHTFSPQALRHAQQACVDEVPAAVPQVSAPPPKPGPQLMGQAEQRAPWCSIGPPLAEDMLTIESEYFKAHDGLGRAVKWSRRTLFRRDSERRISWAGKGTIRYGMRFITPADCDTFLKHALAPYAEVGEVRLCSL